LEKRISCQAGEEPSKSWAFRASYEYGDLTGEEEHDGVELWFDEIILSRTVFRVRI